MTTPSKHTFHIPVMGLGFTIDSPMKIARFGISSVVSIIQDKMIEEMRAYYCKKMGEEYIPILEDDIDHRAKRITSYLDLAQQIVNEQIEQLKNEAFDKGNDIVKYFTLLPDDSPVKKLYNEMTKMKGSAKEFLRKQLRREISPGSIDVNVMTKLDSTNYTKDNKALPDEYADAMSALRGYAKSSLDSSIVFSAGMNPRLYAYMEKFPDFFPDKNGKIKKKIILKVSDYRSALIQGKFLAKKGLWVSEFRIESGLNCGGHAFPTVGRLLGPILEEFKNDKEVLVSELFEICSHALEEKKLPMLKSKPNIRVTVQGGIGTSNEDNFLRKYYNIDGTGWGSPFLMVPEATNVDEATLQNFTKAKKEDYYISYASPLGVPFNNFRKSSSEEQRKMRIEKGKPGSPCHVGCVAFNTEFTKKPICTASREYQRKKLKQLNTLNLSAKAYKKESATVMEKDCLCVGLTTTAFINKKLPIPFKLNAVTICPGPNLAYFSNVFSLEQMVGHIYGRSNILNLLQRPHVFINELKIYFDYLKDEVQKSTDSLSVKQTKYFSSFKSNLLSGIEYYKQLIPYLSDETDDFKAKMNEEIDGFTKMLAEYCSSDKVKFAFEEVK